jgi:hypothetical protein
LAQGLNGSSKEYRTRQEQDALEQLRTALKQENWALVKEAAQELQDLKTIKANEGKKDEKGILDTLSNAGFSLSRSPDEEKKGALFGFNQNRLGGTKTDLSAEFYLKWQKRPYLSEWMWGQTAAFDTLAISVQGKLSSTDSKTSDAWRFRLENNFFTSNRSEHRFLDGVVANLSLKNESDRDFNTNRLSGELWLTVNSAKAYIGKYSGDADKSLLQFRWRPYVGLDAGGTVSDTPVAVDQQSNLWLMARGRADLRFAFLVRTLNFSDFVAYVDDRIVYLTESGVGHNYLDTGIDLEFSDNIGFTLQYTIGADSPQFVREQMLKGGLTIKF